MSTTALTRTLRRRFRDVLFGSWYASWLLGNTDDGERSRSPVLESSWLVRWLTAEPEPDVIVIDLREVRMVSPFILALDAVLATLSTAWVYSRTGSGIYRGIRRIASAPVRVAGVVLLVGAAAGFLVLGTSSTAVLSVLGGLAVLGVLALFETRSWGELRETTVVQWVSGAFSPPEPPERAEAVEQGEQTDGK